MVRPSAKSDVAPAEPMPARGGGYIPSIARLRAFAAWGAVPPTRPHLQFEPSIAGKPRRRKKRRWTSTHRDRGEPRRANRRACFAAARKAAVRHAREPLRNPRGADQQPLPAAWSFLRRLVR